MSHESLVPPVIDGYPQVDVDMVRLFIDTLEPRLENLLVSDLYRDRDRISIGLLYKNFSTLCPHDQFIGVAYPHTPDYFNAVKRMKEVVDPWKIYMIRGSGIVLNTEQKIGSCIEVQNAISEEEVWNIRSYEWDVIKPVLTMFTVTKDEYLKPMLRPQSRKLLLYIAANHNRVIPVEEIYWNVLFDGSESEAQEALEMEISNFGNHYNSDISHIVRTCMKEIRAALFKSQNLIKDRIIAKVSTHNREGVNLTAVPNEFFQSNK